MDTQPRGNADQTCTCVLRDRDLRERKARPTKNIAIAARRMSRSGSLRVDSVRSPTMSEPVEVLSLDVPRDRSAPATVRNARPASRVQFGTRRCGARGQRVGHECRSALWLHDRPPTQCEGESGSGRPVDLGTGPRDLRDGRKGAAEALRVAEERGWICDRPSTRAWRYAAERT